ncbi:MAG: aldo/keto reductase [Thermoplasmata archaeon]|nr:aldo/keto reductase [Thermoplasmata archaeon]
MLLRKLGRSELSVAPLAFGGNVFGWTADEATSFRLLDAFVDGGFNLIDTADAYSSWVPGHHGGESETILGRWMRDRGRRDDVVVATKVGMEMPGKGQGLSRSHIEASLKDSLARLQTDHVDLYQSHVDDAATPIEETLSAYARLVADGSVRAIGSSNFSADRLTASLAASEAGVWPRYESAQPKYNLVDRDVFEGALEQTCASANVGVLTHSSLAKGFLSGKYRSDPDYAKSPRGAAVQRLLTDRSRRILAAVEAVAGRLDVAPASVAIAWVVGRPTVTAAIASATSVEQLKELMDGATLRLDAAARGELDAAGAPAAP